VDTGPLLAQLHVPLVGDETGPDLETRLADAAVSLLRASLPGWLAGTLPTWPQPEAGVSLTRPLRSEDGRLDPRRGSAELGRQVRAYQPWPGTFLDPAGGRLIVLAARASANGGGVTAAEGDDERPEVGDLVGLADGGLGLVTGDGLLELLEVLPAGRRAMSGTAYRRGLRTPLPHLDRPPSAERDRPR